MALSFRKSLSGLTRTLKLARHVGCNVRDTTVASSFSLLGLPAEIRLSVYEYVVKDVEILVSASPKSSTRLPSLAFTCHQVRREVISTLCKRSNITCAVQNFDFQHVQALLRTHSSDLRHNPHLSIRLLVNRSWYERIHRLDEWLTFRSSAPVPVKIHYEAKPSSSYDVIALQLFNTKEIGLVSRLRALKDIDAREEMLAVMDAFQREADQEIVSKLRVPTGRPASRNPADGLTWT